MFTYSTYLDQYTVLLSYRVRWSIHKDPIIYIYMYDMTWQWVDHACGKLSPILQTLQFFHVWKTKDINPTDTCETEILRAAETPKDRSQWKPIIQGWNFMFFSVGRECLLFQSCCFHQKSFKTCVFTYFNPFSTLGPIILHHTLERLYQPLDFIQQIYCITWFFLAFVHQYLIELLEIWYVALMFGVSGCPVKWAAMVDIYHGWQSHLRTFLGNHEIAHYCKLLFVPEFPWDVILCILHVSLHILVNYSLYIYYILIIYI